ncbi:reverse transcriptase domain-containing protein [Tanacetum coccineum]
MLRNFMISIDAKFNSLATSVIEIKKSLQERPQGVLSSNTIPNPRKEIKAITTRSGNVLVGPSVLSPSSSSSSKEVEQDLEMITDQVLTESTTRVPPLVVQPSPASRPSELPLDPTSNSLSLEMLPELVPTRMTLELANRSIAYLAGIAEDVFVQVGKFTFPADFVVVDYDVDPRVPLILGRPFLRTDRALVDVYREELILRDGDEKLIFHANSTSKYPHKHGHELINMINFIDIACEDYLNEVLNVQKLIHPLSGSPTPSSDPVVESLSPSLTPFGDIDFLLEETDKFFSLVDLIPPGIDNGIYDSEGDILFLEELLKDEILRDLPPKELKDDEPRTTKSLIEKPPGIDNEIYDSEGDILFLENLLNDDPIKDLPPQELNNDLEGDIIFLENLLKDEPSETERVSETPLDSFDSSLDNFNTTFTNPLFELDSKYTLNYDNPIFDIQNEDSDASETETIMDEVHSSRLSFYLGLLFPEGVSESHSFDSFKLGDENVVFDPRTIIIKGWIEHYYGGDIPAMDMWERLPS